MVVNRAEMIHRSHEHFGLFGLPHTDSYRRLGDDLRRLGLSHIVGNSANLGRRYFGEDLAELTGAEYLHSTLPSVKDEVTKTMFCDPTVGGSPDGLASFEGAIHYLRLTALSKFLRFDSLKNRDLVRVLGARRPGSLRNTLILLGDSESWVDDHLEEKPKSEDEAARQITRLISGAPYYLVSAQAAMWANRVRGIEANIHVTPIRVLPTLTETERNDLFNTWMGLYKDPHIPITPGGASASNKELLPYIQVGFYEHAEMHVSGTNDARLPDENDLLWVTYLDIPPGPARNEMGTNLMGAAPRGFADVLVRLVQETERVKARFGDHTHLVGQLAVASVMMDLGR